MHHRAVPVPLDIRVQALPADVLPLLLGKRRKAAKLLGAAAAKAGLGPDAIAPSEPGPPSESSWTPAGPAPAANSWSGGPNAGACGVVYGAPGLSGTPTADAASPAPSSDAAPASNDDLATAVNDEIRRLLKG